MVLARKLRQDLGKAAVEVRGTLGISSKTCAESGKERRTATSAPVAETFKAVANSSNSLPLLSRVRTKTGIASGKRAHLRRSSCGRFRFKMTPEKPNKHAFYRIWGAKWALESGTEAGENHEIRGVCREIRL